MRPLSRLFCKAAAIAAMTVSVSMATIHSWHPDSTYSTGKKVSWANYVWQASNLNSNSTPSNDSPDWNPVIYDGKWSASRTYQKDDWVSYNGEHWMAKWWTLNEVPGSSEWGAWEYIEKPIDFSKEQIALVIKTREYNQIQSQISTYIQNVESRFPVKINVITGEWNTPESVRTELQNQYQNNRLKGAMLVGSIPFIKWEMPWGETTPLPFFYEDLDGGFLDKDNDGKYDFHTWGENDGPEIWTSIVKGMTESDIGDVAVFFNKANAYYAESFKPEKKALVYVTKDWGGVVPEIVSKLTPLYGDHIDSYGGSQVSVAAAPYLEALQNNTYEIVDVWTHAYSHTQYFDQDTVPSKSIRELGVSGGLITAIWGCHAGDFHNSQKENVALSYIHGGIGLASFATTRSLGIEKHDIMYEKLAEGKYLGEAYKHWLDVTNNSVAIKERFPSEVDFFQWTFAFFGNPFISTK